MHSLMPSLLPCLSASKDTELSLKLKPALALLPSRRSYSRVPQSFQDVKKTTNFSEVHTVSLLSDLAEVPFALNNEVYIPKDEAQSSPTGPNDDDNVDINDDTVVLDTMHRDLTSPLCIALV